MKAVYIKTSLLILTACCLVFAVLYARMCFIMNGLDRSINRNNETLCENEKIRSESIKNMSQRLETLEKRFHFVDEQDAENPQKAFQQLALTKHQRRLVSRLAEQIEDPDHVTPSDIGKIFREALSKGILPQDHLEIEPVSGRVIDRNAAVLEELCRRFRLKAQTVLLWDLRSMKRGTETRIFSTEDPECPPEILYSRSLLMPDKYSTHETGSDSPESGVSAGENQSGKTERDMTVFPMPDFSAINRCIRHDKWQTFIFSFDFLNILSEEKRHIILPGGEVPLGKLYMHYYSVYCDMPWILSCEFYDQKELSDAGFRVISLLPGSKVEMEQLKNNLILKITPDQYHRSAFLLTADKVLIPHAAFVERVPESEM